MTSSSGSQNGSSSRSGVGHVRAGDDQRVEPVALEVLEGLVVRVDVGLDRGLRAEPGDGERVDVDLHDLVGATDQPDELLLGHVQRGVGHHVEQADVQLADVLRANRGCPRETNAAGPFPDRVVPGPDGLARVSCVRPRPAASC
jgi:hypothetical protein